MTYRLRGLVQLQRDPAHRGQAVLEKLTTVDALPELVAQTSFTRDMDRPLHLLADLAHSVGGVRRATYAEAEQLRPLVRAILDGARVMRARRLDVVDEYIEDGRAAVYSSRGMVLLLSELATTAWEVLGDEWLPSEVVAATLVKEFGDPGEGDAGRLTEEALRSLAELDLVELDEGADL